MMRNNSFCICIIVALIYVMSAASIFAKPHSNSTPKKKVNEEIYSLIQNNRKEEALKLALAHEKDGDPNILAFLGLTYFQGDGVAKDFKKSAYYFRKASEHVPICKLYLGISYSLGLGVPRDKDKAWTLIDEVIATGFELNDTQTQSILVFLKSELNEYTDNEIGLRFPSKSSIFELTSLQRYPQKEKMGYSLRYNGKDGWLDLYVYTFGLKNIPDGISPVIDNAMNLAMQEINILVQRGKYKNLRESTRRLTGTLPKTKLQYTWYSFFYDLEKQAYTRNITLLFGARNKIFKIRFTGVSESGMPYKFIATDQPLVREVLWQQLPTMVNDFLTHLDEALAEEAINTKKK